MRTTNTLHELHLRPYQQDAVLAVEASWDRGVTRPVVVAPVGSGKTVMFSRLLTDRHEPGKRGLVLVHREELVNQAVTKLKQTRPELSVGVYKAERRESWRDLVVASVQTLARPSRMDDFLLQGGPVRTVVCDEAHHFAADTFSRVLDHFSDAKVVGFTATLARNDRRSLGAVWSEVCYTIDTLDLIRDGYLVPPRGKAIRVSDFDLDSVLSTRNDFRDDDLARKMLLANVPLFAARKCRELASDRSIIAFTPTREVAKRFVREFEIQGFTTELILGTTQSRQREAIYRRFESGETQVLVSVMVLTEGFDAPWADCALIARPTRSAALYVQMVGRVLRPYKDKYDALVLDVVGTGHRSLATLADLSDKVTRVAEGESVTEAAEREETEEEEEERSRTAVEVATQARLTYSDYSFFDQAYLTVRGLPYRVVQLPDGSGAVMWADGLTREGTPASEGSGVSVRVAVPGVPPVCMLWGVSWNEAEQYLATRCPQGFTDPVAAELVDQWVVGRWYGSS